VDFLQDELRLIGDARERIAHGSMDQVEMARLFLVDEFPGHFGVWFFFEEKNFSLFFYFFYFYFYLTDNKSPSD
jgi:hypothetical protein